MKLNKNVVFSLALIVFAGVVIVLSIQLQSLFLSQSGDIGPKAFPIGAAVALILCAIGKMLTEGRHEAKPLFDREGWKRVGIMFAIMIGYLAVMWYVGYLISTLIFTPMLVAAMREDCKLRPVTLAIFSVVTTAVLYFVFQNIIMVTLPTGVLFR